MLIGLTTACAADPKVVPPSPGAPPPGAPPPAPSFGQPHYPLATPPPPVGRAVDPATGLPLPPPADWKSPDWRDPGIVLKDVFFDGLPLREVAMNLRKEFRESFDVLIPRVIPHPEAPSQELNAQDLAVYMQLKNVRASEVFHAMNLLFETENTPVRWELTLNGERPLVVLKPTMIRSTGIPKPPPARLTRSVFPVADLIGDGPGQYAKIEELVKTVTEIYGLSFETTEGVQFHRKSQLMVVTGTPDQIRFVQDTLVALREQPPRDRQQKPAANPSPRPPPAE
jgi:hypothetical protein